MLAAGRDPQANSWAEALSSLQVRDICVCITGAEPRSHIKEEHGDHAEIRRQTREPRNKGVAQCSDT